MLSGSTDESLFVDPREYTRGLTTGSGIRLYDTTLRDGEQAPGVVFDPDAKLRIAKALSDIGCHIIDLGFPSVGDDERESLERVLQAKRAGEIRAEIEIVIMSRSDEGEIDQAAESLARCGFGPNDVTLLVFTATSPLHCVYKLKDRLAPLMSLDAARAASLEDHLAANCVLLNRAIRKAKQIGFERIEAGAEDGSRTPLDWLDRIFSSALDAGASRLNFADTTGCLTPDATRYLCNALVSRFPGVEIVNHFHNDFGLATANVITAVECGVKTCSVTVNGIGERAGNASLHSVVTALKYLYGAEIAGFRYDQLASVSRLVERETGIPVGANEPVVGVNAFSHESGVHAHGVLLDPRLYEAIPCDEVGRRRRIVFGKHSGAHAVRAALTADTELTGVSSDESFVRDLVALLKRAAITEHLARKPRLRRRVQMHRRYIRNLAMSAQHVRRAAVAMFAGPAHEHVHSFSAQEEPSGQRAATSLSTRS